MSGFKSVILFACGFLGVFRGVDPARILVVVPTPMHSHQSVFRPYTQQLATRGHHVVVLTPNPAFPPGEAPQNLTEINLHDVTYELWTKHAPKMKQASDMIKLAQRGYDIIIDIFLKQMKTEQVKELLSHNQQFDLVVIEGYMYTGLALAHFYRAPSILMSSCGVTDEFYNEGGVPIHPIFYPDYVQNYRYIHSTWDQAMTIYQRMQFHRASKTFYQKLYDAARDLQLGDPSSLEELLNAVDLRLVNSHAIWESSRPVTPNLVHLGGLHCVPPKYLPEDLKSLMDSSKNGVIYISSVTNADPSLLPPERMAVFARVFSTLPYDVLWKWGDAPQNLPSNVHTFSWLPQADLLRHEKLLLFITQGGLQSTDEALRAGFPLLGIPLWADQWRNVENYERLGVGLGLDLLTITESQLKAAIEKLIYDKSFRERSAKVGLLMEDRPLSSVDLAVWWTERVVRLRGRRLPTQPPPLTWNGLIQALLLAALILPLSMILITMLLFKILGFIKLKTVAVWTRYTEDLCLVKPSACMK